jgi:TonB-dependent SusC/RagA subfamily outer membrane receptor
MSADKKYILTDSHLDGDFLKATNAVDLLTALRGRVPGLQVLYVKDNNGEVKKQIFFPGPTSEKVIAEVMVELDGMVLSAIGGTMAETLESMNVNDIESVDVFRFAAATAYGARAANGVLAIKTRLGNRPANEKSKPDRSKLQVVSLAGYSEAAEFTSPDYSEHATDDDRTDFRSTIYWNPLVMTSAKEPTMVSFYAADIPTRYRIVVEGITADGEAVRGEKIIVVTAKK